MENRQRTLIAAAAGFALGVATTALLLARDPWAYGTQKDTAVPVRYNRSTGESQILRPEGWQPMERSSLLQFVPDPR